MPGYSYKCGKCKQITMLELPISTDPDKRFGCECGYLMKRVIAVVPQFPKEVGKVFAGDWFKKTYGSELGEGSENEATQAEDRKTLEREFRKKTGQ